LGILADGMGGYNGGEVARGMAGDFIKSEIVKWGAVVREAGIKLD